MKNSGEQIGQTVRGRLGWSLETQRQRWARTARDRPHRGGCILFAGHREAIAEFRVGLVWHCCFCASAHKLGPPAPNRVRRDPRAADAADTTAHVFREARRPVPHVLGGSLNAPGPRDGAVPPHWPGGVAAARLRSDVRATPPRLRPRPAAAAALAERMTSPTGGRASRREGSASRSECPRAARPAARPARARREPLALGLRSDPMQQPGCEAGQSRGSPAQPASR